jgi:NDP-sugar pyrophosphorylase family protein/lipopolysaccharide/colanic/teichoic acid biosynthesis glycosyltransferase
MIAMILAAGVGSRLNPLTLYMPKPMVPIANKPVMEHIIDLLAKNGITTIVANLNYMPDQIEDYFGSGERWGVNLTYSLERSLMGTAGAVKRVADIFDDTLFVLMGDALTDLDLKAMLEYHRQKQAKVTIALHAVDDPTRFGVVQVDEQGKILRFQEKPKREEAVSNLVSMGLYILEPEILDLIPAKTVYDFGHQLFPLLLEKGIPFYGYETECYWSDVGSFSEYRASQVAVLDEKLQDMIMPAHKTAPGIWVGKNSSIHPTARLEAPILLGDNVQVGPQAVLGPYATIGSNIIIEEGATISHSTILDGTYVGKLVNVQDAVVNRNCLVNVPTNTSVFVSDQFLLGEANAGQALGGVGRAVEWIGTLLLFMLSLPLWLISLAAALFAGKGPLIEKTVLATNDPRARRETGKISWRSVTVHRLRADSTTAAGRWLTRTGLRNLPAQLAVLRGELSLVGVGWITPEQAATLGEDWQRQRFLVPTGLTGLWYTSVGIKTLEEQMIVDTYYAVTHSPQEDIRLFLNTAGAWLKRIFLPG